MRIGIDCRMYTSKFTGIGRYTYELVRQMIKINGEKDAKHEFVLFFNSPEYELYECPSNVKKVLVNAKHYSFDEQMKFCWKLSREKLDTVHFPHFNIPYFYRRPYTMTIHDLTLSFFPGKKMSKWYHRLAYNIIIDNAVIRAKDIIAVSKNTKKDLMRLLNVPEDRVRVVYNGVGPEFQFIQDASLLQKTLDKYNIKKQFLLYTGVWRDHKNLVRLLDAFKILVKDKNMNIELVMTGKPDPAYPEVLDTIKKHHLTRDVILPGHVSEEELISLYNSALFYVFPSLYEGFGIPPIEAMRCGTPVLASNTSSIPEICGEGNAVFFDPYDVKDIAEKIGGLFKDANMQSQLVANGLTRSMIFTWEKMGKDTYNIITGKDPNV